MLDSYGIEYSVAPAPQRTIDSGRSREGGHGVHSVQIVLRVKPDAPDQAGGTPADASNGVVVGCIAAALGFAARQSQA
jgi:hypothetical protein